MVKNILIPFIIILFWLTACSTSKPEPTKLATTVNTPIATNTVTQPTQTLTPTNTTTPIPHPTKNPTSTPETITSIDLSPTPTATPTFILPNWITEPSANILLLGNQQTNNLEIYNIDTGEIHEINVEIDTLEPFWFWQDDHFLLGIKYLGSSDRALDPKTGQIVQLPRKSQKIVSPNNRHEAQISKQENRSELVSIVDYETNVEVELANPFEHSQSRDETFIESAIPSWSPDGSFLSVLYTKHYYSDNMDYNLVIYTPSGEIYRQYANRRPISWFNPWTPVEPHRIFYIERSRACVIDIIENNDSCLEAIDEWLANRDVVLLNHDWSPDGTHISFIYNNLEIPDTGLCYLELATDKIECPIKTDVLQLDKQMFARRTFWSPDSKYIVLFFDSIGYSEHIIGSVGAVVVNTESHDFEFIEGKFSWPYAYPWRPSVSKN